MIITNNISSILSKDNTGLQFEIDWNFIPDFGAGRFMVRVKFWNEIEGKQMAIENRTLIVPFVLQSESQALSVADLKQAVYNEFPMLAP